MTARQRRSLLHASRTLDDTVPGSSRALLPFYSRINQSSLVEYVVLNAGTADRSTAPWILQAEHIFLAPADSDVSQIDGGIAIASMGAGPTNATSLF